MTKLLVSVMLMFSATAQAVTLKEVKASMSKPFKNSTQAAERIGLMAQYFEAKGDRRGQFASIYTITISSTKYHIDRGSFENPKWVEAIITDYANIYRKTIYKELNGQRSELPLAWQYEYNFIDSDRWLATFDVIYGIKVHITRDLVEALYTTPTEFSDKSIERDFFRISTVLKLAMPDIWTVYVRYSHSLPFVSVFTETAVFDWIARLRAKAWEDASHSINNSKADKEELLNQLDRESEAVHHFGILTILH